MPNYMHTRARVDAIPSIQSSVADQYLTASETAALLGLTVKSLEARRARGNGPPFVRMGRLIRYLRSEVLAWIEGGGQ